MQQSIEKASAPIDAWHVLLHTPPGTEVVAFPLFEVLDGSDSRDYVQRVEPSPQGGAKMGRALMDALLGISSPQGSPHEDAALCGPSSSTVTRDY